MQLPTQESLTVEFKSEASRPIPDSQIVDNIVALANTDGGDLFLGIEDDGSPTGVSREHRNIDQLAAFVFNHTVPPVQVRPSLVRADNDVQIVRIHVDAGTQLVCSSAGRVTQRVLKADGSPEVVTMYPFEFASRLSSIGQYDYSAQPAPDSDMDDLDPLARDRLREQIRRSDADSSLLELGDDAFDGALGLSVETPQGQGTGRVPTITGVLMIGTQRALKMRVPTASIVFQVMRDRSPVVDETLRLPLVFAIPRLEELMSPWNHITERMSGMMRRAVMDYDPGVLREAMLNALCHRDYSMLAPVHVQLDEAGLTVSNPGGFMRGVDAGNLLTVMPTPRNRALADALKRCGYVERTGRGVDRIFEGVVMAGRPFPDYSQSTSERVVLFLQSAKPDMGFMDVVERAERRRGARLNTEDVLVMAAMRDGVKCTVPMICKMTTLDLGRVQGALDSLVADGAVMCDAGRYALADFGVGSSDAEAVRVGSERDAILERMRGSGGAITTRQAMDLLGLPYLTAYRLLKRMQDDGLLVHEGKGRYSRFLLA